jgi:NAD(P)-dependent dehydrogenase (short-subunit alcohol dehydrogenase family)
MGVMLVTGGGRGIGAAVARLAGTRGWDVAVNYSRAADKAEAVAREIRDAGRRAIAVRADVGVEADVVAMFEAVDRDLGPVDALVNNAGVDYDTLIADFELDRFRRVFDVNLFGPALCAREAVRRMSTRLGGGGGVIVNVSSVSARTGGWPRDVAYTASKGALDSFTHGLAKEVGPEGVRVVSVRPGATRTEIFDGNQIGLDQVIARVSQEAPLRRIGEPHEVANLILWACSEEASYVTATCLEVSGGR